MNGLWLFSYTVLWLIVIGLGLLVLALSREIEALHSRLESLQKLVSRTGFVSSGNGQIDNLHENQTPIAIEIPELKRTQIN